MGEIWKDVIGYEGLYQVSNLGRVKSLVFSREKYLSPGKNVIHTKYGDAVYLFVPLSKNGVRKNGGIHRLVAQAFIPNPENKREVNHKDGNPSNNRVENLEWCTHRENILHSVRVLGHSHIIGHTPYKIRCVETGEIFESVRKAAEATGISRDRIKTQLAGKVARKKPFYHWEKM